MSGGYFNFAGERIADGLETIAQDPTVSRRWPRLATAFAQLAVEIKTIEHEIDWDLSGDSALVQSDGRYDFKAIARLAKALRAEHGQ